MLTRRAFTLTLATAGAAAAPLSADVIVYGGSPAGLAAAAAVVRDGLSVIVIEPSTHIGGLITGGIACTDTGTPQFVGGLAAEFFDAVAAETHRLYPKPTTPKLLFRGQSLDWRAPRNWDLEPKVARQIFEGWVKKGGYRVIRDQRVASVRLNEKRITAIRLTNGTELVGKVFVDASYEGDLMARAHVPYTWGRESQAEYQEPLAGVRAAHFTRNYSEEYYGKPGIEYTHHGQFGADIPGRDKTGRLLWGISEQSLAEAGSADRRIQAFCFRLIATQRDDLRVAWPKPDRYIPERYELLLRYIQAHPGISFARLVHFSAIPNGKFDLNASGPFSIDYVGGNVDYPDGDYPVRDRIYRDHVDYQKGFLWFLAHDERVPKELRDEVNSWGLCRDEYPDTGHWPVQIYIREARRMKGDYFMTEHDILKNKRKDDSIGMGSFVLDSHWVQRFVNAQGHVRIEGHLDESIPLSKSPYDIPYRSITPRKDDCRNLLVPVCVSATHVAICTIRMEPVYMMLGHAAGQAAAMAARTGAAVQDVNGSALTSKLRGQGAVLGPGQARPVNATPAI
ncbi:FAD-dependent oxidoreductase [uncultured Paludibaculum sp.]|uniref:FAD-dependent oxidoreductase n=1 Tax=uncultured Paludibaculum sp. TaxID=1765020 RepID=UPI002AAA753A|nr:FAD-dependent oxidoreductase [uncultured Paludibaculum sp.]